MSTVVASRERYRASFGLRFGRFVPLVLLTLLSAVGGGWVLQQLFASGWYLRVIAPVVLMFPLLIMTSITVDKGRCRSRAVAFAFGVLATMTLFGSYYYFGMVALMGPQQVGRLDQLPNYVQYRMRTDVPHGYGVTAGRLEGLTGNTLDNWVHFGLELLLVVVGLTSVTVRRATRAYCERCDDWMSTSSLRFAPGRGQTIAEWLDNGELDQLVLLPAAVASNRSAATKVSIDFCRSSSADCCLTFISVKEMRGAKAEHQAGSGRIAVPRSALTASEVATLRTMFNLAGGAQPELAANSDAALGGALIEVMPVPAKLAHRVLNKWSIGLGTFLTLAPLFLFWAAIAGFYFLITWSHVGDLIAHRPVDMRRAIIGLAGLLIVAATGVFVGYLGLKNSGVVGNRFFRLLARRSFASRRQTLVDFRLLPKQAPIFFVQIIPRAHWGRQMLENAIDTGFMQVDTATNELRFEGDVNCLRIPGEALTHAAVEHYTSEMGKTSLMYSMVTLRGRTVDGPFEAPFSVRGTDWFVKANHRQTNADLLLSWIESIRPAFAAEPILSDEPMEAQSPSLSYEMAQSAPSDGRSFFRRYWFRLTMIGLGIGMGLFNGVLRGRSSRNNVFNPANFSDALLVGARSAKGISFHLTSAHMQSTIAGLKPESTDPPQWTVFDCITDAEPSATFTVAIDPGAVKNFFGLRQDVIIPHTPADGSRLLDAFGKTTGLTAVDPQQPFPLTPTRYPGLRIGEKRSSPETRYTANGGNWVVDQWDLSDNGLQDLLYFSYDLTTRRAKLSRSSQFAAGSAMASLSSALRDGPRPPRSAANDPTFTEAGPTLVDPALLAQSSMHRPVFARGGKLVLLLPEIPNQPLLGVRLIDRDHTVVLAGGFSGQITQAIACDADANVLVVTTSDAAAQTGATGAVHFWLVDRKAQSRREIVGGWGAVGSLAGDDSAVSPDGRYIVFQGYSQQLLNPKAAADLFVYDTVAGTSKQVATKLKSQSVLSWSTPSRAVLTDFVDDEDEDSRPLDRVMLDCSADTTSPLPMAAETQRTISPDGKLRYLVQAQQSISIFDVRNGNGRTLVFQDRDKRFAVAGAFSWQGNRYLQFYATKPMLLDTAQMKLCDRPTFDAAPRSMPQFNSDFKWAWMLEKSGITLARVQTPGDADSN